MDMSKSELLKKICYPELVYGRINKKLNRQLTKQQIEEMLFDLITKTQAGCFQRIGKNIYVASPEKDIRITINSNTFRVITVDVLSKKP